MHSSETPPSEQSESFDSIAGDLRSLREDTGAVSYAELVRRITALRIARGVPAAAAVPARSTVYNAFRSGRSRMDTALLRDIVVALGEGDAAADAWVERCTSARRAQARRSRNALEPAYSGPGATRDVSASFVGVVLIACVALNLLGLAITGVFKLSVYLDMVGTAIAALVLGPWHGVAVAIASNGLGFLTGDMHTLEFTPVNVVGALVWGYGVRSFAMGARISRYVALNVLTALTCSVVAAPIVVALFHGGEGHASEQAVLSLEALQIPFVLSVFTANIVTSVMDKLLTGFIALVIFVALHNAARVPADHMPLVERLGALKRSADPMWAARPVT